MKTALIFGCTGLIGNNLFELLLKKNNYSKIKLFVRKKYLISDTRVETIVIDFNKLERYAHHIKGDDCFFCIGTTKKQTPNKEEYRKIEYTLPVKIGEIAFKNKVNKFVYISSLGSSINSKNTYLKNKAEVEIKLKNLNFSQLAIIRPSLLLGKRKDFRFGELIAQKFFTFFSFLFFGPIRKYKPISSYIVSKTIIIIVEKNLKDIYFNSDFLMKLND